MKEMQFERFKSHDWDWLAGAERFSDGSAPFIAFDEPTEKFITGQGFAILDGQGIEITITLEANEDLNVPDKEEYYHMEAFEIWSPEIALAVFRELEKMDAETAFAKFQKL